MQTSQTTKRIAVDATRERRPGVPEERKPARIGNAHWSTPAKQVPISEVIRDASRHDLTATFGTSSPPRLLSGAMRRAAYRIPDYRVKRWLLLMLADRVDALESRFA